MAGRGEPGRDGVGIGDGARGGHGAGGVYGAGPGGADGMRGDGVGVGDVGEVPGGTGIRGTRRVVMTGGERGRERSAVSCGRGEMSVAGRGEPGRDGLGIGDGARGGHGAGGVSRRRGGHGQTGCEATEWESETSVRCLVGHGARGHATGGDDGRGAREGA